MGGADFVLARAVTYATLFVGLVLVLVPGRIIETTGLVRPARTGAVGLLGLALVAAGAALAAWCVLTFAFVGRGTPAPFDPPRRLVARGPYRYTRNPMYLGAFLALGGAAVYYRSWPLLGYAGLFIAIAHAFVVWYEEPALTRRFGQEYEAYRTLVRRWAPRTPRAPRVWTLGLLFALLAPAVSPAETALPVLEATSPTLDVRDGDRILKGIWVVDPTVPLDIYDAERTTKPKRVTFLSDADSLSFDVEPGRAYDFVIRLNGRDDCRTRISTMAQGYRRVGPGVTAGPDTIPITIDHGKLHLRGTINDSKPLDLIFDTGADMVVLYPSGMKKGAEVTFDGVVDNSGTGGTTRRRTSRDNRLEVAGLRWEHEPLLYVEKQADRADGIVGYRVFQDKVVEFDYDRMVMIVHESFPPGAEGFVRTPMPSVGTLTAVEIGLVNGEAQVAGPFLLDTAGNGALIVNPAFVDAHGLRGTMRTLGTGQSRGVGSGVIRVEQVLLPELMLAGFRLKEVPIHLQLPSDGPPAPPGGALCMEVLRRFNAILDYPRGEAWFKPNSHFDEPFPARDKRPSGFVIAIWVTAIASLAWRAFRSSRRKSDAG